MPPTGVTRRQEIVRSVSESRALPVLLVPFLRGTEFHDHIRLHLGWLKLNLELIGVDIGPAYAIDDNPDDLELPGAVKSGRTLIDCCPLLAWGLKC